MAGREGYGFPKKIGHISFERHEDLVGMYYERPQGLRLINGVFRGLSLLEMPESFVLKVRVIQSPDPSEAYSLADLVLGELEVLPKFAWLGEGNCSYSGLSDLGPWHQLPMLEKIQENWTRLDINVVGASILERL